MQKKGILENILLILGLFFGILSILVFAWGGFLTGINFEERITGPYTYIYSPYDGTSENAIKEIDRLRISIKADGVAKDLGTGIFYKSYSNESRIKEHVGLILSDSDLLELGDLQVRYDISRIEKKTRLIVEFPYHNILSLFSGKQKVYPEIEKYSSEHNYEIESIYELYDVKNKKIFYEIEITKPKDNLSNSTTT